MGSRNEPSGIGTSASSKRGSWPDIAIIGSYPPPYGGISIHLQRLADYAEKTGLDFIAYNTVSSSERPSRVISVSQRRIIWYLMFCWWHRCQVVHLLSTSYSSRVLFGLMAAVRPGKYLLSIHGRSISEPLRGNWIRRQLTLWFLRRMDVVIACNPEIERECREDVGLPEEKVRMIPAFIPVLPDRIQEPPDYIRNFHDTHDPVISSVGWVGQTYQGADIYGLDMLIELVERLRGDYPRLGLVMSVNGGKPEAVEQFVEECRRRVGSSMLLITESLEDISAIFRDSDLFVRPTNTDGDAVSIREALFLGTPVVASDAVPRPEPCVLFKSRDMDDFGVKVREALDCREELTQRIAAIEMEDNGKELIRLYEQVLKGTD